MPGFTAQTVTNNTAADTTPPQLTGAVVNGRTLTLSYDEALKGTAVPGEFDFWQEFRGGTFRPHSIVGVSGNTVVINVTGTNQVGWLRHGETLRFEYTQPADQSKRIQDLSGNHAAAIPRWRDAANHTPPAFSSAAVDGAVLTVTFDGGLDTASEPAAGDFAVTVGGSAVDLADTDPVAVNGTVVTLTLAAAVLDSDAVTVGYTAPETNPLKDADNAMLPVPGFTAQTVTNNTAADTTPPQFVSATVNGVTGELTVTFDEPLDETMTGSKGAFTVTVPGSSSGAASFDSIVGARVTIRAAQMVAHGQTVTVTYEVPSEAAQRLKDPTGNEAAAFAGEAVTNNTPPRFDSAAVDGAALTVTFDGELDEGSTPLAGAFTVTVGGSGASLAASDPVQVSGSAVTLALASAVDRRDVVTLDYHPPGDNPLRDADHAMLPSPGFSGKTVTNNSPPAAAPEVTAVAITSTPSLDTDNDDVRDTYGRGDAIEVTVTWDREVTWVSGSGTDMRVRLDVGGGTKTASLVKGGATTGTARSRRVTSRAALCAKRSVDSEIASGGERWSWSTGFGSQGWSCWRLPPVWPSAVRGSPAA